MERPEDVPSAVQDVFRQYVEAVREFVVTSGRCYLKGWPDRKAAVQNTTKLGHLNCDLQLLRFEYLVGAGFLEPAMCESIEGISDRIWKGWKESDEAALKNTSQQYRDVLAQQQAGWAVLDKAAIEGPSEGARRDPEFLKAAADYRDKYWALDAQLQKLAKAVHRR
jgi:hypothetical protein